MTEPKIGDELWWFSNENAGHWTQQFFADGLELHHGKYLGTNTQGNCMIEGQRDEYNKPEKYYLSKQHAIHAMLMKLYIITFEDIE
jgi:hypothetical protein